MKGSIYQIFRWRRQYTWMWRHVDLVRTEVSEELITSIIRVEIITDLGITLAVNISWGMLIKLKHVRFEVFTAVTMNNVVFWDVTPCASCKNRHFGVT
jgi:hypothetical protein